MGPIDTTKKKMLTQNKEIIKDMTGLKSILESKTKRMSQQRITQIERDLSIISN